MLIYCLWGIVFFYSILQGYKFSNMILNICHFTPMWTNIAAKLNEMVAGKIGNHILCVLQIKSDN